MTITAVTKKDGRIEITVTIGDRSKTMSLAEWSRCIANPTIIEEKSF